MMSELAALEDQVKEYEKQRSGKYNVLKGSSIYDLPIELIRTRIALGLTQKQLAERVGLKEQQIQRYEETEYASASFSRITEIIKALGIKIEEKIYLPKDQQIQQKAL
jgi:ribosome-binding protein aMBF1 (putative translation factor)